MNSENLRSIDKVVSADSLTTFLERLLRTAGRCPVVFVLFIFFIGNKFNFESKNVHHKQIPCW
jgi:hypothetical protein